MGSNQTGRRDFFKVSVGTAAGVCLLDLFPFRAVMAHAQQDLAKQHPRTRFQNIRELYALDPKVTYLNQGSIGTMPTSVREAFIKYIDTCETNPWLHIWGGIWSEALQSTRAKAASFLGCAANETAIIHNTTEGFNLLASGLPLGKGDEVLFSSLNHTGASACWFHQAKTRGYTVRRFGFPFSRVPQLTKKELVGLYEANITDQTKVLVFPHLDNHVGLRHPVSELTRMARARGVKYIAVDGAQTMGMVPLNVCDWDVDFFVTSAHKWLQGPKERGILYVRETRQAELRPMTVTWGQRSWQDSVRKFEDYGTRNLPSIITLADALEFQEALGIDHKLAHYRKLWRYCRNRVAEIQGLTWLSSQDWELAGSLYTIGIKDKKAQTVVRYLFDKHGFVCRPFDEPDFKGIRISPDIINDTPDLDRFFHILQKEILI